MIPEKSSCFLRALSLSAALLLVFPALVRADAPGAGAANLPRSWVDPDTGHRVIRLTDEPGSASLYFTDNGFTPDGKEMIYSTGAGDIGVVTLANFETRVVVKGPVQTIAVGHKTPTVFYARPGTDPYFSTLWATNLDTGETHKLADLPRRGRIFTVNADETMAAGTYIVGDGADYGGPATVQAHPLDQAPNKGQMMQERLARRLPIWLYTVDLTTGKSKDLLFGTDWFNHLQFSPADPTLLMYCHEGMWWLVDRIWTIRTDGSNNQLVHKRTLENEIAGHEWWGGDGETIWYQLHYPMGMRTNFMASYNVKTGERAWYYYAPDQSSIHHNTSRDAKLFTGDGGRGTPWIFLFYPVLNKDNNTLGANLIKGGSMRTEKLVNMSKHDYKLEPNAIFTPDSKFIVFRSNMLGGVTYAFAVEVAKAGAAATP